MMKQIYYRGSLKSCNYHCSYCPFSKSRTTKRELERDEEELFRFVNYISEFQERCAIQIVPYGEALIHDYYWKALAELSKLSHVEVVGAQSNLSFSVVDKIEIYQSAGGKLQKLRLWGTFHPEMCSVDEFLEQCTALKQEQVLYCVGAVGVPENLQLLQELRGKLDSDVYMWINKMDGLGRNYKEEEVAAFSELDEYFELELRHIKADVSQCKEAIFIQVNGSVRVCNDCHKVLGNIYEGFSWITEEKRCTRKTCECFLSYGSRKDIHELLFFQPYPAFRIPMYKKAVFFDVDGTLVYSGERELSKECSTWLRRLSKHSDIYLATSLPYENAMRKVRPVADVIGGGVFAGGGMVRWQQHGEWNECLYNMSAELISPLKSLANEYGYRVQEYRKENILYKVVLHFGNRMKAEEIWLQIQDKLYQQELEISSKYNVITEGNTIQITAACTGKLAGIQLICDKIGITLDDIAVFGNSVTDLEMLKAVSFSVAAPGSDERVLEVVEN